MNHKSDSQFAKGENASRRTRQSVFWVTTIIGLLVTVTMIVRFIETERRSVRKAVCASHLSTIGFALHRYLSEHGRFPSDIVSPTGKPILSWRVELLSILDRDLYERFNREEPWNSEHNLRQLHAMPHYYFCPSDEEGKASGTTNYYAVVPQSTNPTTTPPATFDLDPYADGQCILLVESADLKIPWTKPGDLPGDPCDPGHIDRKLTSNACKHPGGTYIVMVNTIRRSLEDGE